MAQCEKENCTNPATHSVTLNVPAKGVPLGLHSPIKMYIGVELCLEHANEFGNGFTWADNESLTEAIEATVTATGASPVDFDRAFHRVIPLTNPGYQQFLKVKSERCSS